MKKNSSTAEATLEQAGRPGMTTCVKVNINDVLQSFRVNCNVDRERTEFVFPNGIRKTFPTWDVRGIREFYFRSEYLISPDEYLHNNGWCVLVNYGVTPKNVSDFVVELARKPYYEYLFLPKGGRK